MSQSPSACEPLRPKQYPPYQELEVHAGLALYWLEDAKDGGGSAALKKAAKPLSP